MVEKIQHIPHPGLRNIKTAVAATLCILLYSLINRPYGLPLACIAVFLCMQDSVDKSWKVGRDRGVGTLLGGVLATVVGLIPLAGEHLAWAAAFAFVAIVLYIFVLSLLKIPGSIAIGLATFVVILFGPQSDQLAPLPHAMARTFDTWIGILIGCSVNMLLFRPRPERFRGEDTKNPVFHYEHRKASHHKTYRWENGFTEELYVYPEDALSEDQTFLFRLAVNTGTKERSALKRFPGYKRKLMLLDGEMHLEHCDHHEITLGAFEQDVSLGEWASACRGRGTDIQLVTREPFAGKMEYLRYNDERALKNDRFVAFYSIEDGAKLYLTNGGRTDKEDLAKGDVVLISWFENGNEDYTVEVRHEAGETDRPLVVMIDCEKQDAIDA